MKFKKTMRERYPRKTKKWLLKHYTRSAYSEVVHFKERCVVGIDIGNGESFSVICLGGTPVNLEGDVRFASLGAFPANGDDEACKYYSHE